VLPGENGFFSLCLLVLIGFASQAQDFRVESVGARIGGSYTSRAHNFHEADAFANWDLPWAWNLDPNWRLQMQLQLSAGWLGDPGGDAFVGSLGPGLHFARDRFPLTFDGGVVPAGLTRHDFQTKNLGSYFQFTTYAGLNGELSSRLRIGYRFQHMSNAGLGAKNPGLNLHMLAISYKF
jgi:hypothetical protein